MRRAWLSWLFPLLMLFAQQGAYLHELSHYRPADEQGQQGDKKNGIDKVCETCLAFAHLADLAKPASIDLILLPLAHAAIAGVGFCARPGAAPCARSRGPPAFL
jgi:hypothetical protein